jgi:hypothetical protein
LWGSRTAGAPARKTHSIEGKSDEAVPHVIGRDRHHHARDGRLGSGPHLLARAGHARIGKSGVGRQRIGPSASPFLFLFSFLVFFSFLFLISVLFQTSNSSSNSCFDLPLSKCMNIIPTNFNINLFPFHYFNSILK